MANDVKDYFLPLFVAPPLHERDPEKGRVITPEEIQQLTAHRVGKYWPRRVSLLNVQHLCNSLGSMSAHEWMPEIFAIAKRKNAVCFPVLSLASNSSMRLGAQKVFARDGGIVSLRVPISSTQDGNLSKQIYDVLRVVGVDPESTIIVLDYNEISLEFVDDAFDIISQSIQIVQAQGKWNKVIVSGTNYPEVNRAPKNGTFVIPRNEFVIWQKLAGIGFVNENPVIFGDYAADCATIDFGKRGGRRPIPHIRYTTDNEWVIFRGGAYIDEDDDGTIRSIAKKIIKSKYYDGEDFSAADEFIARCASFEGGPGGPTTWRKVNTNRHITKTVSQLLELQGLRLSKRPVATKFIQGELL